MNFKFTVLFISILGMSTLVAQEPFRVGTTTGNFLEVGYGSRASSLGDAYVSMVNDVSATYWNPAGLGYMQKAEFQVMSQPWYVDINTSFVGLGYVTGNSGTFAISLLHTGYGEEEVTTVDQQEGTGENFDGQDIAFGLSYGRRLVDWFSFGATMKYVNSRIWHTSASAVAMDLGVIVNTSFLSWSGTPSDGLKIGMSISNYGTRMRYDGIDLRRPIDIIEDEDGNYSEVPARFELKSWELPLLFRIGVSFNPIKFKNQKLTTSIDALHPNNNSEAINFGAEYQWLLPGFGAFNLRGGYKGIFLKNSDETYSWTLGFGLELFYMNNRALKFDYAFRNTEILGGIHAYTLGIVF